MWGHSEKVFLCKPGIWFSAEPGHAGSLILSFQPLELWENKFLLFKYSICGILSWHPKWTKTPHLILTASLPERWMFYPCWRMRKPRLREVLRLKRQKNWNQGLSGSIAYPDFYCFYIVWFFFLSLKIFVWLPNCLKVHFLRRNIIGHKSGNSLQSKKEGAAPPTTTSYHDLVS